MKFSQRQFLKSTSLAGAALAAVPLIGGGADGPSRKILMAVMGVNGRGQDHIRGFMQQPGVEVTYVCDVDERAIARGIQAIGTKQSKAPAGVTDIRRALDDKSVDFVSIATPDHWHGPAAIMACAAGKHVYVEKPASHNAREGEWLVAAARKHGRKVQLGTQRRSMPGVLEALQKLKEGVIGRVLFSKGWYNNKRPAIGHGKAAPIPGWLNYDLWQGPAPRREYHDNYLHYKWHWFWHWGTGELGNNGIHALDICRMGLGVDCPIRVNSGGGKYRYDDDQETPDTHVVTYDFGAASISWEGRSWSPRGMEGSGFGVAFYGEGGALILDGANYKVYDQAEKLVEEGKGSGSDAPHFQNFLAAIRHDALLKAEIEEGVKSTLLCHLGNIAWRTGHTLHLDPVKRQIVNDPQASALWGRDYEPGWEPRF